MFQVEQVFGYMHPRFSAFRVPIGIPDCLIHQSRCGEFLSTVFSVECISEGELSIWRENSQLASARTNAKILFPFADTACL